MTETNLREKGERLNDLIAHMLSRESGYDDYGLKNHFLPLLEGRAMVASHRYVDIGMNQRACYRRLRVEKDGIVMRIEVVNNTGHMDVYVGTSQSLSKTMSTWASPVISLELIELVGQKLDELLPILEAYVKTIPKPKVQTSVQVDTMALLRAI